VVRDEHPPAVGFHSAVVHDHGLSIARQHVKLAGLRLVVEDGSLSHADSEPAGASAFALATVAVTMLNSTFSGLTLVGILAEQSVVVAVLGYRSHELGSVVAPRRALVHIANWLRLCVAHVVRRVDLPPTVAARVSLPLVGLLPPFQTKLAR